MQYSPPAADSHVRKTFPSPSQLSALPEMGINSGKEIVLSFMTSMGVALSLQAPAPRCICGQQRTGRCCAGEGMVIDRWRCERGEWG